MLLFSVHSLENKACPPRKAAVDVHCLCPLGCCCFGLLVPFIYLLLLWLLLWLPLVFGLVLKKIISYVWLVLFLLLLLFVLVLFYVVVLCYDIVFVVVVAVVLLSHCCCCCFVVLLLLSCWYCCSCRCCCCCSMLSLFIKVTFCLFLVVLCFLLWLPVVVGLALKRII